MTATDLADWHERRRQGIGASEVAAVLGRHPWSSPWAVWARKVGLIAPEDDAAGDAARFGKDLEPITARWFHERTGLHVGAEQMMLTRPGQPWARATVDGLVYDGATLEQPVEHVHFPVDDALGVLELKYTGQAPWEELPEHHWLQVQWQLYVSGLTAGWLAAFHTAFGRLRFEVYPVERDDAELARIVPEVERFWFDHCVGGVAPPTDGSEATTEALKAAFGEPSSDAGSVELSPEAVDALEVLPRLKADAKVLAGDIAAAENVLRAELGEHSEGRIGGFLAVSWRLQHRKSYTVPASDVRVLRLHGRKP